MIVEIIFFFNQVRKCQSVNVTKGKKDARCILGQNWQSCPSFVLIDDNHTVYWYL